MNTMSQQGNQIQCDVLVVGAGIAGLSFVLALQAEQPNADIMLIVKEQLQESNSYYAQGGIAASIDYAEHITDTEKAGAGLCDSAALNLIKESSSAIHFLENHGVQFDYVGKDPDLTREGGHSQRRIFHHGDMTGQEIIRALSKAVKRLNTVTILEQHTAVNLITLPPGHLPGSQAEVVGAYVLDEVQAKIQTITAQKVVLATGGIGKVYRYTSNPDVATGDGIAMAYRAGARVGNMEFVQFHPTLLYHDTQKNFLVSEALRGEGAYLRLAKNHKRFMQHHSPDQLELATRDVVARAIFNAMEAAGDDYVYLDIRHKEKAWLMQRFPGIYQTLGKIGIDLHRDLIPVIPAAHYLCGGVLTNTEGDTDLPGLAVIGEAAFTGLHGANRLASNSLLEGVIMGQRCAKVTSQNLKKSQQINQSISAWNSDCVVDVRRASQINAHWRGLRGEMMSYAGVVRTEAGLKDLLNLILTRAEMIEEYYWHYSISRDLIELRNIILIAELIVRSALNRKESRGGHYRADYPTTAAVAMGSLWRANEIHSRVL